MLGGLENMPGIVESKRTKQGRVDFKGPPGERGYSNDDVYMRQVRERSSVELCGPHETLYPALLRSSNGVIPMMTCACGS